MLSQALGTHKENSKDEWSILKIDAAESKCAYCGQVCGPARTICIMCEQHMKGMVYAICRELLHHKVRRALDAKDDKKKTEETDVPVDPTEVAITEVLAEFPYALADRTAKFDKARRTEGVWFAHLVAYRMIAYIRYSQHLAPHQLIHDEMYKMVRDQIMEILRKGSQRVTPEEKETLDNVYSIPQAGLDGRRIILSMILELERIGKLKINRPKVKCAKCGQDAPSGSMLCESCQQEESLDVRRSIVSSTPPPIIPTENIPSASRSGMHISKD